MKKILLTLFILLFPFTAWGQVSGSLWKLSSNSLLPVVSSWSLTLPNLAGNGAGCASVSNTGLVGWTACGGGGGSWPFTPTTYSGTAVQSTSTPLWLTATAPASLIASSSIINYASSTAITASGTVYANNFYDTTLSAGSTCVGDTSNVLNNSNCVSSVGATWPVLSSGGTNPTISWGGIATSSNISAPQVLYATSANTFASVATGTVSAGSSAITVTANRYVIGGALSIDCAAASGSQNGCLSSTNWTTFNNKQSALTFNYPLSNSAGTVSVVATSTATSPLTFTASTNAYGIQAASASQSGYLAAADYSLLHTATTTFSSPLSYSVGTNAVTCSTCLTANQSITLSGAVSGTGATSITTSYAGTLGNTLGGTNQNSSAWNGLAAVNAGVWSALSTTSMNASITGSAGSIGHSLSPDGATLTGTSFNGSATVSDWAINLGHANTWTALQTINNASTTNTTVGSYLAIPTTSATSSPAGTGATFENTNAASSSVRWNDGTSIHAAYDTGYGGLPFASSTLAYMGKYGTGRNYDAFSWRTRRATPRSSNGTARLMSAQPSCR